MHGRWSTTMTHLPARWVTSVKLVEIRDWS